MNTDQNLFKNYSLLLRSLRHPAFLVDAKEKVREINAPLRQVIIAMHGAVDDLDIHTILKLNGYHAKFKIAQWQENGISVLKHNHVQVMHVSIMGDSSAYAGGIVVILRDGLTDTLFYETNAVQENVLLNRESRGGRYAGAKTGTLKDVLNTIEKTFIQQTLNQTQNRSEAIRLLGVSRRTFYYKIRKYRLL